MGTPNAASSPTPSAPQNRKPVNNITSAPSVGLAPAPVQEQLTKQKAAPPVARKPAHLAAPISPATSSTASFTSDATVHGTDAPTFNLSRSSTTHLSGSTPDLVRSMTSLPGSKNGSVRGQSPPPPQLPRRTNTTAGATAAQNRMAPAGGVPLVGLTNRERDNDREWTRKTQLPSRKPTAPSPHPAPLAQLNKQAPPPPVSRKAPAAAAVDLLADDGGMEMGGWEALKPSS